jgi:hypothetical protein
LVDAAFARGVQVPYLGRRHHKLHVPTVMSDVRAARRRPPGLHRARIFSKLGVGWSLAKMPDAIASRR